MDHSDVANKQCAIFSLGFEALLMGDASGGRLVNLWLGPTELGGVLGFLWHEPSRKPEPQLHFQTASSCMGWASNAQK